MDASQKFLLPEEVPQSAPPDAAGAAGSAEDPSVNAKVAKQELRKQQLLRSKKTQALKKKEGFMRGDDVKDLTKQLEQPKPAAAPAKPADGDDTESDLYPEEDRERQNGGITNGGI
eukprot:3833837-Amphidinium_carterae.1